MRNDARRYVVRGVIACILLIALGVVLIWIFDNVFDGVIMDTLDALSRSSARVATAGLLGVVLLAILLSATGSFSAFRAHRRQQILLDKALVEMQRAQNLAEREMQRKSDLITYLAHDLKTPLSSVIAYLSLLSESPELEASQRAKYTGIALDKAYRLEQLIGELFEIIRFNLQTITISPEKINLRLMLEQLADEFYPIMLSQGKSVAIFCDDDLELRGDSDKLARVFNNILRNAAAYSYENTEIRVGARRINDKIEVTFANHGDPIPEKKLELIFEKFYRLDTSRSSKTGDAGLGLAIAKEIVDAHGGVISVRNDAKEGTVFTVVLPVDAGARADNRIAPPKVKRKGRLS